MYTTAGRVTQRYLTAGYLNIGDLVFYGKWKNAKGRITGFGKSDKGDPTIILQPVDKDGNPKKGQPKELVMLKVRKIEPPKKEATEFPAAPSVVGNMSTDQIVTRIVAKALSTGRGLDVGRTFQNEKWRIHRYRPSITITDLENAGKRGKKVREITIYDLDYTRPEPPVDDMAEELVLNAKQGVSYERMLQAVQEMKEEHGVQFSTRTVRGIDVLPGVTRKIQLEWKTDEYTFRLEATPLEFRVVSSYPLRHPKTKELIGKQDTLYSSSKKTDAQKFYAWLVDRGNEATIKRTDLKTLRELWDHLKVQYDYH